MAAQEPAIDGATTWRDLAVARSLDPARARAEQRVQRFLDAARELMHGSDTKDFTVQQVVAHSGQSLRSFYHYFAGKHELLLALLEESIRTTAEHLDHEVAGVEDPLDRLRTFLVTYYRICAPAPPGRTAKKGAPNPAALADFAQQLLAEHPHESAEAFGPLVEMLEELLQNAAKAGALRSNLDHRRLAGVLLNEIMFNAFASTISGTSVRDRGSTELWDLILHGIAAR